MRRIGSTGRCALLLMRRRQETGLVLFAGMLLVVTCGVRLVGLCTVPSARNDVMVAFGANLNTALLLQATADMGRHAW